MPYEVLMVVNPAEKDIVVNTTLKHEVRLAIVTLRRG